MTIETISNLRPLKMDQILDRATRLHRQNFITFIGIVAIGQVPVTLLQVLIIASGLFSRTLLTTIFQ